MSILPTGQNNTRVLCVDDNPDIADTEAMLLSLSSAGRVEALAFRRRLQQVFRVGRGEFSDRVGDCSGIGPSQVPGMLPLAEPRSIRLIVSRNPRDFSRPPGRKTLADLRSEQDF